MSRQDILIVIADIWFSISLFIQVYYGFKEKSWPIKFATSILTFVGLYVICIAFRSLDLYFTTAVTLVAATLWLILFIQRLIYKKKK